MYTGAGYVNACLCKGTEGRDFPGAPVVKNLPCNAGDGGSSPGWDLRSHMPQSN